MKGCPCKSEKDYGDCCEQFLLRKENPTSAVELMRSRYTAFTMGDIDYIVETHHPKKREELNQAEVKDWAINSTWLGLEIISSSDGVEGDASGKVEFIASYNMDGTLHRHHEVSDFDFYEGKWYFTDGKQIPVKSEKIGRNEPCPCESGKKYKKCCGK